MTRLGGGIAGGRGVEGRRRGVMDGQRGRLDLERTRASEQRAPTEPLSRTSPRLRRPTVPITLLARPDQQGSAGVTAEHLGAVEGMGKDLGAVEGMGTHPALNQRPSPLHQVSPMDGEKLKMAMVGRGVAGRVVVAGRAGVAGWRGRVMDGQMRRLGLVRPTLPPDKTTPRTTRRTSQPFRRAARSLTIYTAMARRACCRSTSRQQGSMLGSARSQRNSRG